MYFESRKDSLKTENGVVSDETMDRYQTFLLNLQKSWILKRGGGGPKAPTLSLLPPLIDFYVNIKFRWANPQILFGGREAVS